MIGSKNKKRRWTILLAAVISGMMATSSVAATPNNTKDTKRSDVRVLIDISGSMKENDPNNLRIPALRIITNLLPKGSDGGVWTYGRYVNMLVPLGTVDEKWQSQANAAASKINSFGLFTNIGDAMAKSTWDWNRPDNSETRSMILLTDGVVDVSKDPAKNEAERQRIFNQILPRLKNAGVTIHTIALSDDADKELLSTLANQTDGWFKAVTDADALQRVFLKIFEQATPRDSLPLENNQFKVDNSVEEMTLLVFKEKGSRPTQLVQPTKAVIDQNTSDRSVRWFASDAYDLITVTAPIAGDWQIDADVDPDNRVMVVSKLGLTVSELANNVLANEQIRYSVKLVEEGEVITKPDFLNLVDARLETEYNGKSNTTPLLLNGATGEFQQIFFAGDADGVLNIKLVVKSPTFERSRTHAINIYGNPVQSDLQLSFEENRPHRVVMRLAQDVINLDTLKVTGKIEYPDETSQFITLQNWEGETAFELKQFPKGGAYRVTLKAEGESPTGRAFSSDLAPIEFDMEPLPGFAPEKTEPEPVVDEPNNKEEPKQEEPVQPQVQPEPEVTQPEVEPEVEQPKETPPEEPKADETTTTETVDEDESVNWTLWLSVGLGGNIVLILGGWFVWRLMRKKSMASSESLAQELFDDEESDSAEEKA